MSYLAKLTGYASAADSKNAIVYTRANTFITMESSEYAQPNFKYIINVIDGADNYKFYLSQNAVHCGVFNLKSILPSLVTPKIIEGLMGAPIFQVTDVYETQTLTSKELIVEAYEGYDVGGVFTEDTSVKEEFGIMAIDGNQTNIFENNGVYALNDNIRTLRGFNEGSVALAETVPSSIELGTTQWQRINKQEIYSPTAPHYRVLSFCADNGTYADPLDASVTLDHFTYRFYTESGSLIQTVNLPVTINKGTIAHIPIGLGRLYNGGHISFASYGAKYYHVAGYNASNIVLTSFYGFVVVEDCKYNPVHLFWLNNAGGFEAYTFNKKSEYSWDVEKKRYQKYIGNYNAATYANPASENLWDATIQERDPIVNKYITLTSDWLTEQEFYGMRNIVNSKLIYMRDDYSGQQNFEPLLIEDSNYLAKRERNSRKYNLTLRFKIVNDTPALY